MFRITPEQLKAADGKVRCCRCKSVFNALNNLVASPKSLVNDSDLDKGIAETEQKEINAIYASYTLDGKTNPYGLKIESGLAGDSEVEKPIDALVDEESEIQQLAEESILKVDENTSEFDSKSQFLLERDDGLESEPDYFADSTESQMSELLNQDSASLLLEDKSGDEQLTDIISLDSHDPEPPVETESITSNEEDTFDEMFIISSEQTSLEQQSVPTDKITFSAQESITTDKEHLPEEDLVQKPTLGFIQNDRSTPSSTKKTHQPQETWQEETRFTFEKEPENPQTSRYRRYWALASLLLMLPLSGQIAWYLRDSLITHSVGKQVLQGICGLSGCSVPIQRDIDKILISDRALFAPPEKPGALSLKLEMVNSADFKQPFPKLQLSLYNDMGRIIARRTFLPNEYLTNKHHSSQMMPMSSAVYAELELHDPGNEVTGFKFDFL
jgi:predicted Zn finger-like uncharacterized protein